MRDVLSTFRNTSNKLKTTLEIMEFNIGDIDQRKTLSAIQNQMQAAVDKGCNELFVAIPNNLKRDYKKLKDFCLFNLKVVSQIACESTLGKKNVQSIATKILLQIIAKKGNILWVPSFSSQIKNTMIAAFDNAAIGGNPVVSCCATFNETFSRVYSNCRSYSSN